MPNYGGFDHLDRDLQQASWLAKSSYLRPDDRQTKRLRRLWWRTSKKAVETPPDAKRAERAERQRNLMNTGSAEQPDPAGTQPE